MCGICGIVNFGEQRVSEGAIRKMMNVLKHRGPDDEGMFIDGMIGLGHVRLSILDLTAAGRQPMFDKSGRYCIIHNGEVYNYVELRTELQSKYTFVSGTDTEVILYAYQEWGANCLDRFNGMFAFAIYDSQEKCLFIARDRFGIKPLYYYVDSTQFIFASEIKGILEVAPGERKPNERVIFDYLVFNRTDQYNETFFENIKRFGHGQYMVLRQNQPSFNTWYRLPEKVHQPFTSAREFREAFVDAVRLRLRSDVPVGVCLSGGLDSSSITSVLTSVLHKDDLQTFSAVYSHGQDGDESEYIDLYRKDVFRMHKTEPTIETLYRDLEDFIECHGEPVSSTGPYAQYKVMELAKGKVTVLLDGQGGDEVLAGYHYFFGNYLRELLLCLRLAAFARESFSYYRIHHSLYALQSLVFYLLPRSLKSRARLTGRNYVARDFFEQTCNKTSLPETLFDARSLQGALLNHFEYKLEHLLKWEDRNSMWFSLESRVPFLDNGLVEQTIALPSDRIINNGITKSILREAMSGIIPEPIRRRRDKIGFLTPEHEWLRHPVMQRLVRDVLHSEQFAMRPYFNVHVCRVLYERHLRNEINIGRDIWKWINLELWSRRVLDSSSRL